MHATIAPREPRRNSPAPFVGVTEEVFVAMFAPVPVPFEVILEKKLFHDAIVALGYVYVDCVEAEPTYIPSWPGWIVCASVAFSPPITTGVPLALVTRPVWLLPRMNSRRRTKA